MEHAQDQTKLPYEDPDEEDIIQALSLENVDRFYDLTQWIQHGLINEDSMTQIRQCFNQVVKMNVNNVAPDLEDIMNFTLINPDKISVVIIGQDPYPSVLKQNLLQQQTKSQKPIKYACGYSFAINPQVQQAQYPASLKNIFKSIEHDCKTILQMTGFDQLHDYMFYSDTETAKYFIVLFRNLNFITEDQSKIMFKQLYSRKKEDPKTVYINLEHIPRIAELYLRLQSLKKPIQDGSFQQQIKQGLLLMNVTWTVQIGTPKSHSNLGWSYITENIIKSISKNKKNVVYMLFGRDAQKMKDIIFSNGNHIIEAPHPSPVNVQGSKTFIEKGPFLKCFMTQFLSSSPNVIQWWD